jgi:hypothetical protein
MLVRTGLATAAAIAIVAVALAVGLGVGSSRGAAGPVYVYPSPGTLVASPTTQISFRGAAPADLTGIVVTGSKSGAHSGRLAAHSDGRGASFLPDHPFLPGETVSVRSAADLAGAQNGAVSFTILTPPSPAVKQVHVGDPAGTPRQAQRFRSEPRLLPPTVTTRHAGRPGQGDLFMGIKAGPGQDGALIVDGRGKLVWFRRNPAGQSAFDVRAQTYEGKPVLTYWLGSVVRPAAGVGKGVILDTSYRQVATVRAANGYGADLHEFRLTPQGTALIIAYRPVQWDLSSVHRSRRGSAIDGVVQEIDVKTGLVLFEWHSLGHVDVNESYNTPPRKGPYDYFHLNSIDPQPDGSLVLSARNTWAGYEIDRNTGNVNWRLGGKRSTFAMGPGARFIGQHDIQLESDGSFTVFDNGSSGTDAGRPSRALVLELNEQAKTATLVRAFVHPKHLRTASQGSIQRLPNGDYLVSWGGSNPYVSEISPNGHVVVDAKLLPTGDDTYRAYLLPWSGRPAAPPATAAAAGHGRTAVYASWNGATDVSAWQVFAGPSADKLQPLGSPVPSTGFETRIVLPSEQRFGSVKSVGASGAELGASKTVAARR